MAMRRLLATAGNRRSAPAAWMSSVEKIRAKVDLSPRVLTASPAGDQPSDLNKFFEISDDVFDKSFPSGAPPNLGILFSRLSRNRLMVRQPALTVIDLMRQAGADPEEAAAARAESAEAAAAKAGEDDNSDEATAEALALLQPPPGLVVLSSSGGKGVPVRGTGKTATLMHCVHWARSQGWLVLHVPKASEVMFGGWWVEPSREVDGDFDQPQVAAEILTSFLKAHADLLATLPVTTAAVQEGLRKPPREVTGSGKVVDTVHVDTLKALCKLGVEDDRMASRVVLLLRGELAEVTQCPVLVAIDEWSCLFEHTSHFYREIPLQAEQMTLVRALRDLGSCGTRQAPPLPLTKDTSQGGLEAAAGNSTAAASRGWLKRGLVLAAETTRFPRSVEKDYFQKGRAGYHLKGNKGESAGARRVAVSNFEPAEFTAACDFLAESNVLHADGPDQRGLLAMYSQFNPAALVERAMLS